jgi:hypothetical protein
MKLPQPPLVVLLFVLTAPAFAAPDCKRPLDAPTLQRISLGWNRDLQIQAGGKYQFSFAVLSTYAPPTPVPACATWTIEPENKGARVGATGLLRVEDGTPAGSVFTVTANIEQGRAERKVTVYVYDQQTHPLVGLWRQQAQFDCDSGEEMSLTQPIHEVEFRASGRFSVTWTPFETYRDYWGLYTTDVSAGSVVLRIDGGNYQPVRFRGEGTFVLSKNGTLELRGAFLGDPRSYGTEAPAPEKIGKQCRYLFSKIATAD